MGTKQIQAYPSTKVGDVFSLSGRTPAHGIPLGWIEQWCRDIRKAYGSEADTATIYGFEGVSGMVEHAPTLIEEKDEQIDAQAARIHALESQLDAWQKGMTKLPEAPNNISALQAHLVQSQQDRADAVGQLQAQIDEQDRELADWKAGKLVLGPDGVVINT